MLVELLRIPEGAAAAVVGRIRAIANLDVSERQRPQDGRFWHRAAGREVEFRVSILPAVFGESVVLRVLDRTSTGLSVAGLGAGEMVESALRALAERPHGLVLVAGPTGSGKTTTLYAILNEVDRERRKVVTVEDPIEYELPRTVQLEVSPQFDVSFGNAVRSIVRQDPDVILIGEIRDAETAAAGLEASLTGHLVLATLHAADGGSAVRRLVDLGAPRALLLESLAAILTQRLLRRLCTGCRRPLSGNDLDLAVPALFEAAGCGECAGTGYRGRLGIFEVLPGNPDTVALLADDQDVPTDRLLSGRSLLAAALDHAARGTTSPSEVRRVLFGDGGP